MESWNARVFAQTLMDVEFDGALGRRLEQLTQQQLTEIVQALHVLRPDISACKIPTLVDRNGALSFPDASPLGLLRP